MRPGAVEVWGGNVRLAAEPCRSLARPSAFAFVEDSIGPIGIFNDSRVSARASTFGLSIRFFFYAGETPQTKARLRAGVTAASVAAARSSL
jgi:hypothetical protein